MKALLLIISTFIISFSASSQSYLGKSKEQIKELADETYDNVELISETPNSLKLQCDEEINEFFIAENACVKFNCIKSYKCNCLATDLKAYNENLKSIGSMKWISKDGDKLYQIELNSKDYMVSIIKNEDKNIALKTN